MFFFAIYIRRKRHQIFFWLVNFVLVRYDTKSIIDIMLIRKLAINLCVLILFSIYLYKYIYEL